MSDYYKMRSDKYEVIHELGQSERVFILEGFIVQKDEKDLEEKLNENFELSLEFIKPAEDEEVPVKLKNNAFAAPLESVVESFSLPGKGDIDPSFISALFYYILFGFMFSDAGYGLILTIACGTLLLRFKNMEPGTKKFFGLFLGCGIGTTIMGVLFGSFFADTIPVVARTFFGKEVTLWHWMDPNSDPMGVLRLAFAVGIIHIFVGLGAKAYMNTLFNLFDWDTSCKYCVRGERVANGTDTLLVFKLSDTEMFYKEKPENGADNANAGNEADSKINPK
jgi:V/A-type H+-transporting ATPase subunit I